MEAKTRKSINFDLNIKKLKEHYPNNNYTEAYNDIKKFLLKNGFEHRQGSGYISKEAMTKIKIAKIIKKLNNNCYWLYPCCKTLDYYDVGKEHSGLEILENINKDKALKVDKIKDKEIQKEIKKQTYKISNYQPKNKTKNKNNDIER